MSGKTTLELYRTYEGTIDTVSLYDNSTGSSLLFEARAGTLQTLMHRKTFDKPVTSVLYRVCGSKDETTEHIVLECGHIGLPGATPLRTALGFAGEVGVTNPRTTKVTMQRLERWRAVVVSQRSRTQGGAVQ
ncbi:hypothetical protein MTO96_048948 [Rhipicephalus appendiculatus]